MASCKRFFQKISSYANKVVGHPYAAIIALLLAGMWIGVGFTALADGPQGYGMLFDAITVVLLFLMQRDNNTSQDVLKYKVDLLLLNQGLTEEIGVKHMDTDEEIEHRHKMLERKVGNIMTTPDFVDSELNTTEAKESAERARIEKKVPDGKPGELKELLAKQREKDGAADESSK